MEVLKKIIVLGGGESGVGAALLAQAKGFSVFLSDAGLLKEPYKQTLQDHQILFEEGSHSERLILEASEIIKSPGISDKTEIVKKIMEKGIPVISEIEFAARYTKAKFIAITGSNGKTTTALLAYHLLKNAGISVGLAGNIGESFAKQVIEDTFNWYVLELSSFQLDNVYEFRADVAILLNITPDHLDRYGYKFENYVKSKCRVLQNMTSAESFIFWQESESIQAVLAANTFLANYLPVSLEKRLEHGAFIENGVLKANTFSIALSETPLKGSHNAINTACAVLAVQQVGLSNEQIREGLLSFQNAPHRLEFSGEKQGIRFINDSKATNVDSVFYALGSFDEPIILIIGGVDKGNDYSQIEALVRQKVKTIICLGINNEPIFTFFKDIVSKIIETQTMAEAVQKAYQEATSGNVVLLSPACASFDLFNNYEDRGNQFKKAVAELVNKQG